MLQGWGEISHLHESIHKASLTAAISYPYIPSDLFTIILNTFTWSFLNWIMHHVHNAR